MEEQTINQEIIERLMKEDLNFMYKIDLVKEQIVTNLGTYADSIGEFEDTLGLDENGSRKLSSRFSEMTSSLGTIGEKITQLQIEVPDYNTEMSYKFDDMADSLQEGFAWLSEKLTDNISNILEVVEQNNTGLPAEGVFEANANNVVITDMSDKVYDTLNNINSSDNSSDYISQMFDERTGGSNLKDSLKGALLAKLGLTGVGAIASKLGFVGIIITAIALNAFNGIKGYLNADDWGVSKVSAIFGGILGGGSNGGMQGSVKGGLTGVVSGMAIGIPFGIIGMIIGGAIGGAVGAIGGWIGSEKIAKGFDKINVWFSKKWGEITKGFQDGLYEGVFYLWGNLNAKFENSLKVAWGAVSPIFDNVWDSVNDFNIKMADGINGWLLGVWNGIKSIFNGDTTWKDVWDGMNDFSIKMADGINGWLSDMWSKLAGWFRRGKEAYSEGYNAEIPNDSERIQRELLGNSYMDVSSYQTEVDRKDRKTTEDAIQRSNVLLVDNAEAQRQMMLTQNSILDKSNILMQELVDKQSTSSGGGGFIADMGEFRESSHDYIFEHRYKYHASRYTQ